MRLILLFALFSVAACNSCVPQPQPVPPAPTDPTVVVVPPPPPPVVDAGPEPNVDRSVKDACRAISAAGCVEGANLADCEFQVQKALDDRLTPVPLACLVGAHTKDDVRACGRFVPCP
jgi:hypothetical protein